MMMVFLGVRVVVRVFFGRVSLLVWAVTEAVATASGLGGPLRLNTSSLLDHSRHVMFSQGWPFIW